MNELSLKVNGIVYIVSRTQRFCSGCKKHQYENRDQAATLLNKIAVIIRKWKKKVEDIIFIFLFISKFIKDVIYFAVIKTYTIICVI